MKGVFIIIDGLGDLPCSLLNDKTPLEAAKTPNLDELAKKSKLGYMYSVKEGIVPESDSAILSVLGHDYFVGYRGILEALGARIEVKHGDLAVRTNFATIDNMNDRNVVDRRAGRNLTTKEATILTREINNKVKLKCCKFIFKNTAQHRGVLILKGGFSDNITNTDPAYHSQGKAKLSDKFKFSVPLDDEEITHFTANAINEFIEKSYKVLAEHPINKERKKKGLLVANILLTRDASIDLPELKKFDKWGSACYMPLEIGISKLLNMTNFPFNYPDLKSYDVYENLFYGLKIACKFAVKVLRKQYKKYDYIYFHFKETDIPGHDNKPLEKKAMVEMLDKEFFSYLKKFAEKTKIKVLITADHSTPCKVKGHSDDPVPVLFYDGMEEVTKDQKYCEKDSRKGELGKIYGKDLFKKTGFT